MKEVICLYATRIRKFRAGFSNGLIYIMYYIKSASKYPSSAALHFCQWEYCYWINSRKPLNEMVFPVAFAVFLTFDAVFGEKTRRTHYCLTVHLLQHVQCLFGCFFPNAVSIWWVPVIFKHHFCFQRTRTNKVCDTHCLENTALWAYVFLTLSHSTWVSTLR